MIQHPFLMVVPAAALILTASAGCGGEGTAKRTGATGLVRSASAMATATASTESQRPSAQDRAWLADIHQVNLAEVQAGELARKKGATAAVRSAGEMLAADHGRLDDEVTRVAGDMDVTLPKTAAPADKAAASRLENESGRKFDQDFLATMITGHEKAIRKTEQEISQGSSPQVVALARKAMPDLKKHLSTLRKAETSG